MSEEFTGQTAEKQDMSLTDQKKPIDLFGALKGTIIIKGDIVAPLDEIWEAEK